MKFPNRARLPHILLALAVAAVSGTVLAQERASGPGAKPSEQRTSEKPQGLLALIPPDAVSEQTVGTQSGKLDYIATAGTLSLFGQSGERAAAVYYTAYVAKGAPPASRPITFVFNGGPGAASAYLHLGLVGPRIAEFGPGNRDGAAARLKDNPDTWLEFTDLVLIDPVGAGWSRPAKADGGEAFWGVRRDAQALAKFIALYIGKNRRGASPKYLLGESYGGFRSAKVARALQREQGIVVAGIVMVSPMLEGAFQFGGNRFALGAALQLPSLAAAALERNGTFSKEALAQAERFALTEYLTTLAGTPLTGEAADAFYGRVAQIAGLPKQAVARTRGLIGDAYVKHLRAPEGKIVSRYDATFAVDDPHPEHETAAGPDPLLDGVTRAYGSAFANYARNELGFHTELTYNLLASGVSGQWDWHEGSGRTPPSVSADLRALLAFNPSFRLLVSHGYTDMVTPYGVSRYVLDQLPDIGEGSRVKLRLYRGGHMFYLDEQSRREFSVDAKLYYLGAPRD
jgi:carboxypeptidase C (cathepsin A)